MLAIDEGRLLLVLLVLLLLMVFLLGGEGLVLRVAHADVSLVHDNKEINRVRGGEQGEGEEQGK